MEPSSLGVPCIPVALSNLAADGTFVVVVTEGTLVVDIRVVVEVVGTTDTWALLPLPLLLCSLVAPDTPVF